MITTIRLQHFRSYDDAAFDFDPGVNVIVGPNASGKTNLLEAVLVAVRGGSYRARDAELVQFEASWARIDAETPAGSRVVKLRADQTISKTFEIDGQTLTRLHSSKTLPVVLFEPNHLLLLSGSPELRRTFLDELIEQTDPRFGPISRHYRRVLSQRNALLKKQPANLAEQLFVWNVRLSELGGQIARQRTLLIEQLNQELPALYSSLAHRPSSARLHYTSRFRPEQYESELLHRLESSAELDALRGFTAYGPHRDDMEAYIDGHLVQETASRGETRTLVLALKLLELRLVERARDSKPLLLLDDVFSELDSARRQALTTYLREYQTFMTTTNADIITQHFKAWHHVIRLPDITAQA